MAAALSRDAAARSAGELAAINVEGRKVEIEVQKDGRVIGHANATLNLDRMLRSVLGFARRDQGEIPFAIDRQGGLYTQDSSDRDRLQTLGIERTAAVAAEGTPRRSGNWIIYSLPARRPAELEANLKCLKDCVGSDSVFRKDLHRLARLRSNCCQPAGIFAKEAVI